MKAYQIAYMMTNGEFDITDYFEAENDDAANEYADNTFEGDWYVLDVDGNNING